MSTQLFIPASTNKRVVIIGGGFGGITLAKKLKNAAFQIVLIDKHNYHTFQPLLYQVATGGLEPDSIAYPIRNIFKKQQNFHFRLAEVISVNGDKKMIITTIGELSYDYLVIGTGSTSNFFGLKQVEKNSNGMKSLTEALDIRSLVLQNFEKALNNSTEKNKYLNIVIVGGGPTGVELAGAFAELKKHVLPNDYPELDINDVKIYLVESGNEVLGTFSNRSSEKAIEFLKKLGVEVLLNTKLKEYDGNQVTFDDGRIIVSKCVVWSAGVKGVTIDGIHTESINKGNRIIVDEFNKIKNHENIFAIGDVAFLTNNDAYPNGYPMVAQVALQQAKQLAKNLTNLQKNTALKPFHYFDLGSMATIGRNKAVAEFSFIKFRGFFAWIIWMVVHLMALVGFRNRVVVFINWLWNYLSYDRAIRLIVRPYKKKNS